MSSFVSTLPPSASAMERALEQVFWEEIAHIEREIKDFLDPWKCRLDLLPYLAWEVSVDDWDDSWDEKYKRQVVAAALEIHTYKGTRYAIDKSIEAIRSDGLRAIEWFEDPDNLAPGEFRVDLVSKQSPVDDTTIPQIRCAVKNAKNTRSHLKSISVTSQIEAPEKLSLVSRQGVAMKAGPWIISSMVAESNSSLGCLSRCGIAMKAGPWTVSSLVSSSGAALGCVSRQGLALKSGPWVIRTVTHNSLGAACISRLGIFLRSGPLPLVLEQ